MPDVWLASSINLPCVIYSLPDGWERKKNQKPKTLPHLQLSYTEWRHWCFNGASIRFHGWKNSKPLDQMCSTEFFSPSGDPSSTPGMFNWWEYKQCIHTSRIAQPCLMEVLPTIRNLQKLQLQLIALAWCCVFYFFKKSLRVSHCNVFSTMLRSSPVLTRGELHQGRRDKEEKLSINVEAVKLQKVQNGSVAFSLHPVFEKQPISHSSLNPVCQLAISNKSGGTW